MSQNQKSLRELKVTEKDREMFCQHIKDSNYGAIVDFFRDTKRYSKPKFMIMKDSSKCTLGEDIICGDDDDDKIYVGRIIEMAIILVGEKEWPLIKCQLFYTYDEIKEEVQLPQGITNKDLFLTEKTKWFMLAFVEKKIDAHNIKDLDSGKVSVSKWDGRVFIYRDDYNTETKQFDKGIDNWKKYCYCGEVYNPQEGYIECGKCFDWIHSKCSLLSDNQLLNIRLLNYVCENCGTDPRTLTIKNNTQSNNKYKKKSSKSSKKDK